MPKTTLLTALVCVNLVLATAIVIVAVPPTAAYAQAAEEVPPAGPPPAVGALADSYLMVTGQIQSEFDALYVIDMRERTLHTFYFRRGTLKLQYAGYRLLERDFRFNE